MMTRFVSSRPPVGLSGVFSAAVPVGLLAGIAVLAAGSARAEAPRFTAAVERDRVTAGEPFVYEVTLSVGNDQVSEYHAPDWKGLRVLSTPAGASQSTQMQFGGAGMFVQLSYSWRYEVMAPQKGTITIGPARVRVNGQEFRSNPVRITVVAAGGATPASPPLAAAPSTPPSPSPSTSSSPPSSSPQSDEAAAANGGSFIRLVTDKQKVFVGEGIAATWYLYMNEPADKYDTQVEPRAEGFWTEDVTVASRRGGLVLTQESVQGRSYQVGTVMKKALFPLREGRLSITPMEAEISRSDFFGNAVRSQRLRATPTTIEVSPLPKAGQPHGFDAANVGTFTMNVRVDRAQVGVGEAVTLTIELSGTGNVRKLALPAIPKLEGWKAYDPRVNVVVDPSTGVSGTKTAEVLLLPERPGTVTLPALVLDVFDPQARRYTRVQAAPIVLTATGDGAAGLAGAGGGAAGPGGEGPAGAAGPGNATGTRAGGTFSENVLTEEIRPLHARPTLRRELGTTFFRTRGFTAALVAPPLALGLALLFLRLRERLAEDTGSRRRRRARQKVRAHLAAADGHRRRGEIGAFYIEIDRVVREALASRLGRTVKGLRMDELRALLSARGAPAGDVERVIAMLEECDRGRFAPAAMVGSDNGDSLKAVQDGASELIDAIDRAPLSEEGRA